MNLYSPHTGNDLNAQFTYIRIEIKNQVKVIHILRLNCHTVSHINMKRILD